MIPTRCRIAVVAMALAIFPVALAAQERGTVTGRVVDATTQQPLPGAQVTVAGTTLGVIVNQQGRFLIPNVPAGPQEVRVTLIGYGRGASAVTVAPGQSVTVDFALAPTAVELEGVVVNAVTGQAERRRELGNTVGTISERNIEPAAISRPAEVLQGRVAGVTLQNTNGTTGTGQKIRIRGANSISLSNEPLIIVDGIRYENNTEYFDPNWSESGGGQTPNRLNDLAAEDIASIEVLKGPAASGLYGTAAANGVIVITTRRGTPGRSRFDAFAETGRVTEETRYPANIAAFGVYGDGEVDSCPLIGVAAGECTQTEVARFSPLTDPRTTPFRTGIRQMYGARLSGGGELADYFVSGSWEREEGVSRNNDLQKLNLRANLRTQPVSQLTLTATTSFTQSSWSQPSTDNSVVGHLLNGLLGSALFDPASPDDVWYAFGPSRTDQFTLNQDINRFTGSLNANWRPRSWLTGNLTTGLDFVNNFDHQFLGPDIVPLGGSYDIGFVEESRGNTFSHSMSGALIGTRALRSWLTSSSTLGFDYNRQSFGVTRARGEGVTPGTRSLRGTSSGYQVDEFNREVVSVGGLAQQQLGFNDRLFLTGALRVDDNSAFGADFGLVSYPSVSGSWIVSEEPFFPRVEAVSSFRLRAAYGQSGLRPNFRDALSFFTPSVVRVNEVETPAIFIGELEGTGNPNLRPERTAEFETGFDLGLLQDRIGVEFTYFNKRSRDALIARDLAPSLGVSTRRFENLGRIDNTGLELSLEARLIERANLGWEARVSGATLRNRVVELGEGIEPIQFNRGVQRHEEGLPAGGFWSPRVTFRDVDGDGLIAYDATELQVGESEYIGPVLPTFTGQLSTSLRLGDFLRLSTLFDSRRGHYQYNYTERFRCAFTAFGDRGCAGSYDPGASLREQAAYLAGILGDPETQAISNGLWIERADFVKWRELALTLSPPARLVSRIPGGGRNLSLTIAGRNLHTWTDYSGTDPEANETGSSSNFTQGEFGTQPTVRYWTARVNFTF